MIGCIFNYGNMIRDFTYIDDIVESIVRLVVKPASPNKQWTGNPPHIPTSSAPYQIFNIGNSSSIKLIASCDDNLTVSPVEIKNDNPLCVDGTLNAIAFTSEHSGTQTIIGRGAGGVETASSILRDLIDIRNEISKA